MDAGRIPIKRLRRSYLFLVVFAAEAMNVRHPPTVLPLLGQPLLPIHAGITAALLVTALLLRRSERGKQYWLVSFALFVGGVAVLLSTLFGPASSAPRPRLVQPRGNGRRQALPRASGAVIPILVLMAIAGVDRGAMYLRKGGWVLGLGVGIGGFMAFAALAYAPLAKQPGTSDTLLSLLPWILMFVLANGSGRSCSSEGCSRKV